MTTLRFDRHAKFTPADLRQVMNLNRRIEDIQIERGTYGFSELVNNLNGLFDGYLYTETPALAAEYGEEIHAEVRELYTRLEKEIREEGEFVTLI
jgi:hypothetical protein